MIEIKNLSKSYRKGKKVIDNINLEINKLHEDNINMNKEIASLKTAINNNTKMLKDEIIAFINNNYDEIQISSNEMCLSNLRHSDLLGRFITNIFPNATDVKIGCNYAQFSLYDFICYIPTSAITGIEIDTKWFIKTQPPIYMDNKTTYIQMNKYLYSSTKSPGTFTSPVFVNKTQHSITNTPHMNLSSSYNTS